ncbi:ThiF family adenylyltransferase [Bradyrhizobium arachidis]|uniref:ThiF family adenylyltransferase n=1 Tax=Bradyrhizobium arachidis TaxID=858423 RepID=UPI00142D9901|nr:ThiF family adenylyltransferase [Bradyrhizobium arachidis]
MAVAQGLDVVVLGADEVLIQFGSRSKPAELLRDAGLTGVLGRLLDSISESPKTMEHLGESLGVPLEKVRRIVVDLVAKGLLTAATESPVQQYLKYTYGDQSSLQNKKVSIVGLGPVGIRISHGLAESGVPQLNLLDDRKVDEVWRASLPLFGLGHQIVDGKAHDTAAALLAAAGSGGVAAIDAKLDVDGVQQAILAADLTIVALEQTDLRLLHLINRVCVKNRRPWMMAMVDGNIGLVGPAFLPPYTACYNCLRTLSEAPVISQQMSRRYRQHIIRRGACSYFPGLPAFAEVVGGYASFAALQFLLQNKSFVLGRVQSIYFDRMLVDVEDVLRLPRCPVCSRDRPEYTAALPLDLLDIDSPEPLELFHQGKHQAQNGVRSNKS